MRLLNSVLGALFSFSLGSWAQNHDICTPSSKTPYYACTMIGNATEAAVQTCQEFGADNSISDTDVSACINAYVNNAGKANSYITDNKGRSNSQHCTCADFSGNTLENTIPYGPYTTWCDSSVTSDSEIFTGPKIPEDRTLTDNVVSISREQPEETFDSMRQSWNQQEQGSGAGEWICSPGNLNSIKDCTGDNLNICNLYLNSYQAAYQTCVTAASVLGQTSDVDLIRECGLVAFNASAVAVNQLENTQQCCCPTEKANLKKPTSYTNWCEPATAPPPTTTPASDGICVASDGLAFYECMMIGNATQAAVQTCQTFGNVNQLISNEVNSCIGHFTGGAQYIDDNVIKVHLHKRPSHCACANFDVASLDSVPYAGYTSWCTADSEESSAHLGGEMNTPDPQPSCTQATPCYGSTLNSCALYLTAFQAAYQTCLTAGTSLGQKTGTIRDCEGVLLGSATAGIKSVETSNQCCCPRTQANLVLPPSPQYATWCNGQTTAAPATITNPADITNAVCTASDKAPFYACKMIGNATEAAVQTCIGYGSVENMPSTDCVNAFVVAARLADIEYIANNKQKLNSQHCQCADFSTKALDTTVPYAPYTSWCDSESSPIESDAMADLAQATNYHCTQSSKCTAGALSSCNMYLNAYQAAHQTCDTAGAQLNQNADIIRDCKTVSIGAALKSVKNIERTNQCCCPRNSKTLLQPPSPQYISWCTTQAHPTVTSAPETSPSTDQPICVSSDKEPYFECTTIGNATEAAVQTCMDYGIVNSMSNAQISSCQNVFTKTAQNVNVYQITANKHKNNPQHCTCANFDTNDLNLVAPYTGYTSWCSASASSTDSEVRGFQNVHGDRSGEQGITVPAALKCTKSATCSGDASTQCGLYLNAYQAAYQTCLESGTDLNQATDIIRDCQSVTLYAAGQMVKSIQSSNNCCCPTNPTQLTKPPSQEYVGWCTGQPVTPVPITNPTDITNTVCTASNKAPFYTCTMIGNATEAAVQTCLGYGSVENVPTSACVNAFVVAARVADIDYIANNKQKANSQHCQCADFSTKTLDATVPYAPYTSWCDDESMPIESDAMVDLATASNSTCLQSTKCTGNALSSCSMYLNAYQAAHQTCDTAGAQLNQNADIIRDCKTVPIAAALKSVQNVERANQCCCPRDTTKLLAPPNPQYISWCTGQAHPTVTSAPETSPSTDHPICVSTDKEPYYECTTIGNATEAAVQTCMDYGIVNSLSDDQVEACQDAFITTAQNVSVTFITGNTHKNNPHHCTCADYDTDNLNLVAPYTGYTTWCSGSANSSTSAVVEAQNVHGVRSRELDSSVTLSNNCTNGAICSGAASTQCGLYLSAYQAAYQTCQESGTDLNQAVDIIRDCQSVTLYAAGQMVKSIQNSNNCCCPTSTAQLTQPPSQQYLGWCTGVTPSPNTGGGGRWGPALHVIVILLGMLMNLV